MENSIGRQKMPSFALRKLLLFFLILSIISSVLLFIEIDSAYSYIFAGHIQSVFSDIILSYSILSVAAYVTQAVAGGYGLYLRHKNPYKEFRYFTLGSIFLLVSTFAIFFSSFLVDYFFFYLPRFLQNNLLQSFRPWIASLAYVGLFSMGFILVSRPMVKGVGKKFLYAGIIAFLLYNALYIGFGIYSTLQIITIGSNSSGSLLLHNVLLEYLKVGPLLLIAGYVILFFSFIVSAIEKKGEKEKVSPEDNEQTSGNMEIVFEK